MQLLFMKYTVFFDSEGGVDSCHRKLSEQKPDNECLPIATIKVYMVLHLCKFWECDKIMDFPLKIQRKLF